MPIIHECTNYQLNNTNAIIFYSIEHSIMQTGARELSTTNIHSNFEIIRRLSTFHWVSHWIIITDKFHFILCLLDIPEITAPKIDPFVTARVTSFRTRNQNAPISINIRNTNTTMYGMKRVEVVEVRWLDSFLYSSLPIAAADLMNTFVFCQQRMGSRSAQLKIRNQIPGTANEYDNQLQSHNEILQFAHSGSGHQ